MEGDGGDEYARPGHRNGRTGCCTREDQSRKEGWGHRRNPRAISRGGLVAGAGWLGVPLGEPLTEVPVLSDARNGSLEASHAGLRYDKLPSAHLQRHVNTRRVISLAAWARSRLY